VINRSEERGSSFLWCLGNTAKEQIWAPATTRRIAIVIHRKKTRNIRKTLTASPFAASNKEGGLKKKKQKTKNAGYK